MHRRSTRSVSGMSIAVLGGSAALAVCSGPAAAQQPTVQTPAPNTVSAIGTARVKPEPNDRKSNDSIKRAVKVARQQAIPKALADGRERAANLAALAGLPLGALISVGETAPSPFGYFGPYGDDGTFGPGRYCGTIRTSVFRTDAQGRRQRVGSRARRTCRIPPYVTASLTVVYAAR